MTELLTVFATLVVVGAIGYGGYQLGKMVGSHRTRAVEPKKELPENVMRAMAEYVEARLKIHGGELPLKMVMMEFAKWHGSKNLSHGILRPEPPPLSDHPWMPTIEMEC